MQVHVSHIVVTSIRLDIPGGYKQVLNIDSQHVRTEQSMVTY